MYAKVARRSTERCPMHRQVTFASRPNAVANVPYVRVRSVRAGGQRAGDLGVPVPVACRVRRRSRLDRAPLELLLDTDYCERLVSRTSIGRARRRPIPVYQQMPRLRGRAAGHGAPRVLICRRRIRRLRSQAERGWKMSSALSYSAIGKELRVYIGSQR